MVSAGAEDTTVAQYRPKWTFKLFTGSNFIQNSSSDVYFAYRACSSLRIVHIMTIIIALNDLEKWNCPTLTSSETSKVKLSAKPNIDNPKVNNIPLLASGERELRNIKK